MAWYDEVFEGTYDRFTFHRFTPELNLKEAEFIRTALQLRRGEEVLDLACGFGRHALILARKGIRITGIDITDRYLEMAREKAGDLPVEFHRIDLRQLDWQERFDAVFSYFTSFGFYDDETNFDILRRVARALRPGGRFLLDVANREIMLKDEQPGRDPLEFEEGGIGYVVINAASFELETSTVHAHLKLYGGPDGPEEMRFSVRLYTLAELRWLLSRVGLEIVKAFGDADASPYSAESPRLAVVARKV
jgi:SAM-dependent methyltransferase